MTRSLDKVTVSVYSSPENEPLPYVTDTEAPVSFELLVGV